MRILCVLSFFLFVVFYVFRLFFCHIRIFRIFIHTFFELPNTFS